MPQRSRNSTTACAVQVTIVTVIVINTQEKCFCTKSQLWQCGMVNGSDNVTLTKTTTVTDKFTQVHQQGMVWYGIVGFNVPLDTI